MADIVIDTQKLNMYAQRLFAVNKRLKNLDRRLDNLYTRIGLAGLFELIQADALICYNKKLCQCQAYLSKTALDFERLEKSLINEDPLSFNEDSYNKTYSVLFGYGINTLNINNIYGITQKYFSVFSEHVSNKINKYIDKISNCNDAAEAVVEWYSWFRSDLLSDFDTLKGMIEDIYEDYTFKKPELLPNSAEEFFDTLSECQILIDTAKSLAEWHNTGDGWKAYEEIGLSFFGAIVKKGNAWLDKIDNLKYIGVDKQIQNVLIDTIIEMPEKWIGGIKKYAETGEGTAGSIVTETVMGSLVESAASAAAPVYVGATALTYPIVDQICEAFGYDLSGEYERLTGKKGLDAVFSAQKELWVDIVYEGVKENTAKFIDGCYNTISQGWKHWKSGIELIFGGG